MASCLSTTLVFLSGCAPSGLAVVSVKGTVLRQGAPVEDAMVMFVPVSGGRSTAGKTDSKGEFTMITPGAKKAGCVPGKYDVLVIKNILVKSKEKPAGSRNASEAKDSGVFYDEKSILPDKYANAATSGLEAEVARRGKNHFVFNLDDK